MSKVRNAIIVLWSLALSLGVMYVLDLIYTVDWEWDSWWFILVFYFLPAIIPIIIAIKHLYWEEVAAAIFAPIGGAIVSIIASFIAFLLMALVYTAVTEPEQIIFIIIMIGVICEFAAPLATVILVF